MKVLTNDPSVTAWGWAVVQLAGGRSRILDSGCIKTESEHKKRRIRKSDDTTRRLDIISKVLVEVNEKHGIDWVLSEAPHGSQSSSAAMMIGAVAGIASMYSTALGLPIEWYSEGDCKKHLSGKRSLTKEDTINLIAEIYGEKWKTGIKYKDEAVADALAVFHVGRAESQALIFAANQ